MNRLFSLLCLSWWISYASSFLTSRLADVRIVSGKNIISRLSSTPQRNEDFPPEEQEEYTGSVDWDAEWKKVVASEGKSTTDRPGKDYYKSEAEIAAIKAANKAVEKAAEAGRGVANMTPDIRSLSGDWKFWIGILVVVSVGLSLLSAPPAEMVPPNNGSYYI